MGSCLQLNDVVQPLDAHPRGPSASGVPWPLGALRLVAALAREYFLQPWTGLGPGVGLLQHYHLWPCVPGLSDRGVRLRRDCQRAVHDRPVIPLHRRSYYVAL